MSEVKYWVGFNMIPGVGRVRLGRLIEHFGNLGNAWRATGAELTAAGLDARSVRAIVAARPALDLDAEMERLERSGVRAVPQDDPLFPRRLREIYDSPPVLYVRGSYVPGDEWALAVVGTRRPTMYGREVTERLTADLVRNGITVVSGLARGIDTIAHRAALAAGGRTVAVLASGVDIIYPPENRRLAEEIAERGALVCDYPLGTKPRAEHFPRRNRIMSGLALGTLVIEAAENSGALITARMALEQDREVFAVPGSILSPASTGANRLIRDGAKAVLGVEDILEELNLSAIPRQLPLTELAPEDETESLILKHLAQGPAHIDDLCRASALPISTLSSTLTLMELKGMVSQLGNMNYAARGTKVN